MATEKQRQKVYRSTNWNKRILVKEMTLSGLKPRAIATKLEVEYGFDSISIQGVRDMKSRMGDMSLSEMMEMRDAYQTDISP